MLPSSKWSQITNISITEQERGIIPNFNDSRSEKIAPFIGSRREEQKLQITGCLFPVTGMAKIWVGIDNKVSSHVNSDLSAPPAFLWMKEYYRVEE